MFSGHGWINVFHFIDNKNIFRKILCQNFFYSISRKLILILIRKLLFANILYKIWSHLLKKSLMESFICCAVLSPSRLRKMLLNLPKNFLHFIILSVTPLTNTALCRKLSKKENLKSESHPPFYFILKALFVLNIYKFLSWLSGHVVKTARLEIMLISKFMTSQPS